MYLLIEIGINGKRTPILVSKTKKRIEEEIKTKGYYWSKKFKRYIDDKNHKSDWDIRIDYLIEKIDELK